MRHHVLSAALSVALLVLGSAACTSPGSDPVGAQRPSAASSAAPVPSGPPQTIAPTNGCAAMDSILAEALSTTSQGQAFSADVAAGQDSQSHWLAFVTLVDGQYRSQLEDAAGGDETAQAAIQALDDYVMITTRLSQGEIPEFADEREAEMAVKEGREPEVNPAYQEATDAQVAAHTTLTACMPSWPVVF